VVGVILNLAISFTLDALNLHNWKFDRIDYFVATVAIGAWLAMERFKIAVIPTLASCALLGMLWKIAF
jgi:chromate transporter